MSGRHLLQTFYRCPPLSKMIPAIAAAANRAKISTSGAVPRHKFMPDAKNAGGERHE